jgi:hypothetical protein
MGVSATRTDPAGSVGASLLPPLILRTGSQNHRDGVTAASKILQRAHQQSSQHTSKKLRIMCLKEYTGGDLLLHRLRRFRTKPTPPALDAARLSPGLLLPGNDAVVRYKGPSPCGRACPRTGDRWGSSEGDDDGHDDPRGDPPDPACARADPWRTNRHRGQSLRAEAALFWGYPPAPHPPTPHFGDA